MGIRMVAVMGHVRRRRRMEPARCTALAGRGDMARVRPMPAHIELVAQNRPDTGGAGERIRERLWSGNSDGGVQGRRRMEPALTTGQ